MQTDIKTQLIEAIQQSHNTTLLSELYQFMAEDNRLDEIYPLSQTQQQKIAQAQQQVKNGEYLSQTKANDEIAQWLDK